MFMAKKRKLQTIKVPGHWVFPSDKAIAKGRKAYYVKPYAYKRESQVGAKHKKHLPIRVYPGKRLPPTPRGYVLDQVWRESAADERVVYTYKIEALVQYTGRYVTTFNLDKDVQGQIVAEYYHTRFEPTIAKATADFHEQMALLNAYGHVVEFLAIDLYRVTGEGRLTEKNWKLVRPYDKPEEVK